MKNNTALIIIDVQIGAFDGKKIFPLENGREFLANVMVLLDLFRKSNFPVIFVQDCGDIGGAFEQDSEHWPIHPLVQPNNDEFVILKNSGNAFIDTSLKEKLDQLGVKRLVLTGVHSEKCVTETFLAAIEENYKVIIPEKGHSTISSKGINYIDKVAAQNDFFASKGAKVLSMFELKKKFFSKLDYTIKDLDEN